MPLPVLAGWHPLSFLLVEMLRMNGTVLVTGGNGFVASWCIVELLRRGYRVRTTVRSLGKEAALRAAIAGEVDAADRLSVWVADLTDGAGWDVALAGCDYVLHVASPLGIGSGAEALALSVPARDGTLRVLQAAARAGVKRVVMTSAATTATPPLQSPDSLSDESVWFDPNEQDVDAYRASKRLAERAAWEFMRGQDGAMGLTTILPGAVFGPLLGHDSLGSVQVIGRLLQGAMPATPRLGFEVVDVRDLADLHIRAMTATDAGGQRYLANGEFVWMGQMAALLRSQLGAAAAKVPRRQLPDLLFRVIAWVQPELRGMVPRLGRRHLHSSQKARSQLGWTPRPASVTVLDCARSLIGGGHA